MADQEQARKDAPIWRVVLAGILDFTTAFFGLAFLVALARGSFAEDGLTLVGGPAFVLFGLILAYFVVFNKYLGGTIWKRILGAYRSAPQYGPKGPPTWRIVGAAVLDFFTAFLALGAVIGSLTGSTTEKGFSLDGGPAMLLLALIALYFYVFNKFLGGTLWKRILHAQR